MKAEMTSQDVRDLLLKSKKFRAWYPGKITNIKTDIHVGEKHYTPQELAEAWGVSPETIRQIFREEEGVLKIGKPGTRTKRGYFTLRIPESVADRVHRKLAA